MWYTEKVKKLGNGSSDIIKLSKMRPDIEEVLQLEMTHTALNEAGYWGGTATRDDSYSIKLEGNLLKID